MSEVGSTATIAQPAASGSAAPTAQPAQAGQVPQPRRVIIRTHSAGCFAGEMRQAGKPTQAGMIVNLVNARRLWYWAGAASLSQLAMDGTALPNECKFPCPVAHVELINVIEIIDMTEKAWKSVQAVPEWKA